LCDFDSLIFFYLHGCNVVIVVNFKNVMKDYEIDM